MHPPVVEACRADGQRRRALRNKPRTALHTNLPTRQRVARVGPWQGEASTLRRRLRLRWNRRTPAWCSVGTTLPAPRAPRDRLSRADQGRWHGA
ncbi:MAG TPA: hypothetical protein VLQ80_06100 [Candidatus Saccharimonadia bacterium]|nr:hypothetical protein [Candidatus Saccharimonadia bacterium]